ncbi:MULTISPECIES: LysE family transporter [Saccharibacillus]|uniref:LysE family transporter n=1 Tax=Saccharibacillus TaxID=456492 RepID=UPI00123C3AEB|nr:LysE family transporter [Saccharibacillus sp. WB 17]MWJ30189.1 LysE family transporter [Saccharibacillus sp. WB 17]
MMLLPLLSYAFAASFTPGPNNLMALDGARRFGFRGMRSFVLGVSVGCFGVILLSCLLNLMLYRWLPGIRIAMGLLGTAYMLWLAFRIVQGPGGADKGKARQIYSWRTGFLLQFINPKLLMYGITAISTFVMPYEPSPAGLLGTSLLLGTVALASSGCWALFGALFQPFLLRHERSFNAVMALLMLYSAAAVWL